MRPFIPTHRITDNEEYPILINPDHVVTAQETTDGKGSILVLTEYHDSVTIALPFVELTKILVLGEHP
jgi:hypothetical protein